MSIFPDNLTLFNPLKVEAIIEPTPDLDHVVHYSGVLEGALNALAGHLQAAEETTASPEAVKVTVTQAEVSPINTELSGTIAAQHLVQEALPAEDQQITYTV